MTLCGALGCCIGAHQRQLVLWSLAPRPRWQAMSHEHLLRLTGRESRTELTSRSEGCQSLGHLAAKGLLAQPRRLSLGTSESKLLSERLQRDYQASSRLHCNCSVTVSQAFRLAWHLACQPFLSCNYRPCSERTILQLSFRQSEIFKLMRALTSFSGRLFTWSRGIVPGFFDVELVLFDAQCGK